MNKELDEVYCVDYYTKDDYKLSNKQFYVIYYSMDYDLEKAKDFVKTHIYTEVCEKIKLTLCNHNTECNYKNEDADIPRGRGYGKNIIYLKDCLEKMYDKPIFYMSRSYGNKYIVPEKYFNNLTNEIDTYKRVLNIIKEKRIDMWHLVDLLDQTYEMYLAFCKSEGYESDYILTQEEFDLLKRYFNDNR